MTILRPVAMGKPDATLRRGAKCQGGVAVCRPARVSVRLASGWAVRRRLIVLALFTGGGDGRGGGCEGWGDVR